MSYYNQLTKFLSQAKTNNLKTKHFDSEYLGTEVNVSFGMGNMARIPWISFLIEPNTTRNGIYPVYLYYKDFELLILAYGVSETNKPSFDWAIHNKQTIKKYFEENYSQKPDRYGSSYIFKSYEVKNMPSSDILDQDLKNIINEYKHQLQNLNLNKSSNHPHGFKISSVIEDIEKSGLKYSNQLIVRFVASIITKPFVILTGLSGSGKTKLAQAFVHWICKDDSKYKIIPVGADWTNREPLLGYPNGLEPNEYVAPDSGALQLIMDASNPENKDIPFFMILDEMNLSHVERYFADFLSVMESKDKIKLYSGNKRIGNNKKDIPEEICWPKNLFVIGTVNIDETTYMFSPKVLDRANVIEFRISENEMSNFLKDKPELEMKKLFIGLEEKNGGLGQSMAEDFLKLSQNSKIDEDLDLNKLNTFFEELQKVGAEFGYRSASEIMRLLSILGLEELKADDSELSADDKIDIAIMQKLLPKLHGSRKKLFGPLEILAGFCIGRINDSQPNEQNKLKTIYQQYISEGRDSKKWEVKYSISFEKIERMMKNAIDNGFTSYAEA